jgi:hypothetical protein
MLDPFEHWCGAGLYDGMVEGRVRREVAQGARRFKLYSTSSFSAQADEWPQARCGHDGSSSLAIHRERRQ